jgi:hypothetical protein
MIYVRWLGAFRKSGTLHESINFEFNRQKTDEVAVEPIKEQSYIFQARVGLLTKNSAIIKKFNGDCWSEYVDDGKLEKTRNPRHSNSEHLEAWAIPVYTGIVCKGRNKKEGYYNLPKKIRSTIKWYSDLYNLPIYNLIGNKLVKINI